MPQKDDVGYTGNSRHGIDLFSVSGRVNQEGLTVAEMSLCVCACAELGAADLMPL